MKLLVCGTRNAKYDEKEVLAQIDKVRPTVIIEGCCTNSADVIAEKYARLDIEVRHEHFPSNTGNYLKRNVEMVNKCDCVLAFWDGWSYGTAHTIAQAVLKGKNVAIILVKR